LIPIPGAILVRQVEFGRARTVPVVTHRGRMLKVLVDSAERAAGVMKRSGVGEGSEMKKLRCGGGGGGGGGGRGRGGE